MKDKESLFVYTSGPELCGKSALAEKLSIESEGIFNLVSADTLVKGINGNPLTPPISEEESSRRVKQLLTNLSDLFNEEENIIFDDRMLNPQEREVILSFMKEGGKAYKTIAICFPPLDLVEYFEKWKRIYQWKDNKEAEMLSFISDQIKAYVPPTEEEADLIVDRLSFSNKTGLYSITAQVWGKKYEDIECSNTAKLIEFFTFVDSKK